MVQLTLRERRHVAALQVKLGEGGDLAKDRVGPLVLDQCMAQNHVEVFQVGQLPETLRAAAVPHFAQPLWRIRETNESPIASRK